ncbi:MAG TPA: MFS transporter [Steroidobacter sp.]|uniref:MFS transporter n=1 Tax=Steroidobacter sp. TaxID=1978227 RepID=UPI002EDA9713
MSSTEASAVGRQAALASGYPWLLIGLLWPVAFVTSAGRSTLIAVMPQLREEFTLSATQLALVNSAAFWIYAIGAFLFGRLGDGSHRSRLIVFGLVFWSVATGLTSVSTGLALLIALRGLVAIGEASYYPTGTALISDWHAVKMRGRALSVHQTGVFAGASVGALSAGLIADRFGWRVPFVILGSVGMVVCAVLFRSLRDAPHGQPATAVSEPANDGPLRMVLKRPPALYVCAVFFLASGAGAGIAVWAPTFLHDTLGLDLAGSALYGLVMMNIAGLVFVPLGTLLAERFAVRTPMGHFYTLAIGLALAGLLLLPLVAAKSALGVGWVLLASSAGKGLFDGCIYAAMHDVVPRRARGTAVGLMTMIGFCGAGLMPIFVAQASGVVGMAAAMTSMAVLYFIAAVLLLATRASTRNMILETRHSESHS